MKCIHTLAALCCCVAVFASCKKNNNNNNNGNTGNNNNTTASTTKQLLEAGKWQLIAKTTTLNYNGKDTTVDVYATMPACEKDDFITYADNGISTKDENTNVCSGDQQTTTGKWALLNNDTKLALIDSNPDTADLLEMTATEMKFKYIGYNSSGKPLTNINTYKNIK